MKRLAIDHRLRREYAKVIVGKRADGRWNSGNGNPFNAEIVFQQVRKRVCAGMRKQSGQAPCARSFRFVNLGRGNLHIDVLLQREVDRVLQCQPLRSLLAAGVCYR